MLDAELKSLSPESAMDTKLSAALNERFVARCKESGTPLGLLACLNDEVHRYASFNPARVPAISLTNNLLFVVVRMMDSIYEYQPESIASPPEESIGNLSYTNWTGKTYFLYQGVTRTGKPRFYFSSKEKTEAESVHSIPEGYEIYERPESGQVFLRKAIPKLISEAEQQCIASAVSTLKESFCYVMDCQKQYLTIFESAAVGAAREIKNTGQLRNPGPDQLAKMAMQSHFLPILRFELVDKKKRQFRAQRFCFLGRIETWISLGDRGKLSVLVRQYIPLLGIDELYKAPFGFMG